MIEDEEYYYGYGRGSILGALGSLPILIFLMVGLGYIYESFFSLYSEFPQPLKFIGYYSDIFIFKPINFIFYTPELIADALSFGSTTYFIIIYIAYVIIFLIIAILIVTKVSIYLSSLTNIPAIVFPILGLLIPAVISLLTTFFFMMFFKVHHHTGGLKVYLR